MSMNRLRVFSTLLVCLWHFSFCSRTFRLEAELITITPLVEAANASPDFSPSAYSYRHRTRSNSNSNNNRNDNNEEIDLGTTLVAIKYSGGVIVGADTRTSVGGYVSNKFAYKINPIFEREEEEIETEVDDNNGGSDDDDDDDIYNALTASSSPPSPSSSCVLCRSGSAADTQWLANKAKRQFRVRKLERPGYRPSITEVAHYLRYQMRDKNGQDGPLQASLICAGYDGVTGGGQIFGIIPGGSLWEEDNFCVSGSGSTILLGYLDALDNSNHNFSLDYTEEEAIALVTKLLRLSIARDGSSGGLVRLYVINRKGLEERTVYPFTTTSTSTGSSSSTTTSTNTVSKETNYADLKGFAKPSSR